MENVNWYKMDNVAKVFLATCSKRDTRTLRLSCTLKEDVDPEILQKAVLLAIYDRPQFQVRIRRGIFWHYLEDTDIEPVVTEEHDRICPVLYVPAKAMLHYQVTYFGRRINLDMFHALADGTGAMEFLKIIVFHYIQLKHPGRFEETNILSGASEDDLNQDSYKQFFGNKGLVKSESYGKAYHPRGIKLPYNQLQFFEIHMPAKQILAKVKELNVSLTSYIAAAWMLAIYGDMPPLRRNMPVTISLPVNLRNYYPSNTSRNFFNNVSVSHVFDKETSIEELAAEFDARLKSLLTEDNIKAQMDSFETMEYVAPVRPVPLFIKQRVVKYFTARSNRKVSMVLSNMGKQSMPGELNDMVETFTGFCSSNNIFSTIFSFKDDLSLGVASPYMNTGVVKNMVRRLSESGIDIKVYATEVFK
ncbi:MAG: hypothetical protein IJJ74_11015 [Eubacterium sp.]|nr:hypothetical protein [Eubacterium sp.]